MMKYILFFATSSALFFTAVAAAHIRMNSPIGRMGNSDSAKFIQSNPANPGPDTPGPCSTFTTPMATRLQYKTGETISINLTESINHPGRFIVQFSPSGPSGFWLPSNQMANVADTQSGGVRNIPIKFPAAACDNCMMRVLQQMDDQPGEFYVHCFDIKLVADSAPPVTVTNTPVNNLDNGPKFGGGCGTIKNADHPGGPFYFISILVLLLFPLFVVFYFRNQALR